MFTVQQRRYPRQLHIIHKMRHLIILLFLFGLCEATSRSTFLFTIHTLRFFDNYFLSSVSNCVGRPFVINKIVVGERGKCGLVVANNYYYLILEPYTVFERANEINQLIPDLSNYKDSPQGIVYTNVSSRYAHYHLTLGFKKSR